MKVVFFENIYYDYEFGVVWRIGVVPHLIRLGCICLNNSINILSVTTDILGYIFNPEKIWGYQVMATTSNFKFDPINEIFDLSNGMFLTVNNIFHQSVKSSFEMNCCH